MERKKERKSILKPSLHIADQYISIICSDYKYNERTQENMEVNIVQ